MSELNEPPRPESEDPKGFDEIIRELRVLYWEYVISIDRDNKTKDDSKKSEREKKLMELKIRRFTYGLDMLKAGVILEGDIQWRQVGGSIVKKATLLEEGKKQKLWRLDFEEKSLLLMLQGDLYRGTGSIKKDGSFIRYRDKSSGTEVYSNWRFDLWGIPKDSNEVEEVDLYSIYPGITVKRELDKKGPNISVPVLDVQEGLFNKFELDKKLGYEYEIEQIERRGNILLRRLGFTQITN